MYIKSALWLLFIFTSLLIYSCQPKSPARTGPVTPPDSALYFKQVDIQDPFMDTIFQDPDQKVVLNKKLYPPPLPEPEAAKFKEIEGFRVQIFAATDSINALEKHHELISQTPDSIHFFLEKGLYKIQIGDYQFRYKADSLKTLMRRNGYSGAWVVQRKIQIPVDTTTVAILSDSTSTEANEISGKYKIQVAATGSVERAQEIVVQLRDATKHRVFYEESGKLFKVFIGLFETETEARLELDNVRALGYPDAWLVY